MLSKCVAFFHFITFVTVSATCSSLAGADPSVAKLDEYIDACVQFKRFNGSVLVAKNGRTLLSKGYGMANFEHDVANTPKTKFRIGSITKQFTAMAVMLLHEKGKLNVEDPISKHLPDAPKTWEAVTIHHLLTHTSGIPSYTNMLQYGLAMMLPQSIKQMTARFKDKPLEFSPGERFRYSNSGYFLLGVIIEKASGASYEEFLRQEICDPLELHDTGYDRYKTVLKHRAGGYERRAGKVVHARYLDMSQPYAAGSMYSTVEDLLRWDQALQDRKLISEKSYQKMFTPEKNKYAYGWFAGDRFGRKAISHGGGINGFRSHILRFPEEKLCVVVLCNVQTSNPGKVAGDLAAIVLGEKYEKPKGLK